MRKCLTTTIFIFISMFMLNVQNVQALPRNFRNVDTFYVGAMPSEQDLDEFKCLGITTIVSLHKLPPEVQKKAKKLGIELHSFPLRTRLLHIEDIMEIMRNAKPNSLYLHCLHGADRTGAVTAYWLFMERHLDPFTALVSVMSPSDFHLRGLNQLGREYGMCLDEFPRSWVGIYSGAKNGGLEGLKICGDEWYTKLARNFLIMTLGQPINDRNERFWKKYNKY